MPHVADIGGPGDVGHQRAHQIGPSRGRAQRMTGSPVVTNQVDRSVELFEFGHKPVAVTVGRGIEAVRNGRPESGRRQRDNVVAAHVREHLIPDRGSFRHPMDEHDGHDTNSGDC